MYDVQYYLSKNNVNDVQHMQKCFCSWGRVGLLQEGEDRLGEESERMNIGINTEHFLPLPSVRKSSGL